MALSRPTVLFSFSNVVPSVDWASVSKLFEQQSAREIASKVASAFARHVC
jgi:hypothetical protein